MTFYKRLLSFICAIFAIMPALLAPAFAVDEYFNVYPYLFFDDFSKSFENLKNESGDYYNYTSATFPNRFGVFVDFDSKDISGTYIVNMSFSALSNNVKGSSNVDLNSFRPYVLYFNYVDNSDYSYQHVINFDSVSNSYNYSFDDFDFYYSRKLSTTDGSLVNNFVDNNINFIIKDTFKLESIYISFGTTDDPVDISFSAYGPTVLKVDSTSEDLINSLGSLSSTNSQGFQDVVNSVVSSSSSSTADVVKALSDVQEAVKQSQKAVENLENNFEQHTQSALEKYFDEEEKKVVEAGNAAVDDIVGQLPLLDKKEAITNVFTTLMTSISDDSTDCKLKFPAGTVTVAGNTYTFWKAQTIDFNSYFSQPGITLLLLPLRFIFVFGLFKYAIFWIKKIVSTILME